MIPNNPLTRLYNSELEQIELHFEGHSARLCLQGAHLVSCIHAGIERLWLSSHALFEEGLPIRGGVPVCWPWFGPHPTDSTKPAHGPARTAKWDLLETFNDENCASVTLGYTSEDPEYRCKATLHIELNAVGLRIALGSLNTGDTPLVLTEALHTYFPISDLNNAAIKGLLSTRYADKLNAYEESTEHRDKLYLTEPTDRVYFDTATQLQLIDSAWSRTTTIEKSGSQATVIWNPGAKTAAAMADLKEENYRHFLCIESANALSACVSLAPGETHWLEQRLIFS